METESREGRVLGWGPLRRKMKWVWGIHKPPCPMLLVCPLGPAREEGVFYADLLTDSLGVT